MRSVYQTEQPLPTKHVVPKSGSISRFKRPGGRHPATAGTTFNFVGFTHVWGLSRQGKNVVRQITAKDCYARALASVMEWCRLNLHRPFREQHALLSRVIRRHCACYGISRNGRRIRWYPHQVTRIWRKWLARRGRYSNLPWSRFRAMLARYPLPTAKIVRQYAVHGGNPLVRVYERRGWQHPRLLGRIPALHGRHLRHASRPSRNVQKDLRSIHCGHLRTDR